MLDTEERSSAHLSLNKYAECPEDKLYRQAWRLLPSQHWRLTSARSDPCQHSQRGRPPSGAGSLVDAPSDYSLGQAAILLAVRQLSLLCPCCPLEPVSSRRLLQG